MTEPLIALSRLSAGYGADAVLENVDLKVSAGEVVLLIGPNGSGKTTLLRSIIGRCEVLAGEIRLFGEVHSDWSDRQRLEAGVCYLAQGMPTFEDLTVEENLRIGAFTLGWDDASAREEEALGRFPSLAEQREKKAQELSGGEKRLLGLAWASQFSPRLLLLDEPSAGLNDPDGVGLFPELNSYAEGKSAVLLAEQNVKSAMKVATRVVALRDGRVFGDWSTPDAEDHLKEVFAP